jgi:hypothetical protein
MISKRKNLALLLSLITVSSCLISLSIKPVNAQTIDKPSVPKFSIVLLENGYQMDISNQPIIPNGHDTAGIFYDIRIKNHFAENWVHRTVPNATEAIRGYIGEMGQSGNTTLTSDFKSIRLLLNLSSESQQIDFQVEAINGYLNTTDPYDLPIGVDSNSTPVIFVNTSGWSDSQTVTIPSTSTQVGTDLLLPIVIVLVAVVIALLLMIMIIMNKRSKSNRFNIFE